MKKKFPQLLLYGTLLLCCLSGCRGEVSQQTEEVTVSTTTTSAEETTTTVLASQSTFSTTESLTSATTEANRVNSLSTTMQTTTMSDLSLSVRETLSVYEVVTLRDFILTPNISLLHPDETVATDTVGRFGLSVSFLVQGVQHTQMVYYTVKDTTAPLLLDGGYQTTLKKGTAFDLNAFVGYVDNYDRHPILTYSGTVNTNEIGTYPLQATVTDSSGNQTKWNLKVSVVEQLPTVVDRNERLSFDTFRAEYGGNGKELGIDVSKWQGTIDFQAVKKAGCSFVIMRIGYSGNGIAMDDCFKRNIAAAKAANLRVGVYFYSTANTVDAVKREAQWIVSQLNGQSLDFPIAFDWESFSRFQQYEMNITDLNTLYRIFDEEISRLGYHTMLYSSKIYLLNFWDTSALKTVWLAHYTKQTDYTGKFAIWQMSCRGRIPGIDGDVDLNIYDTSVPLW